MAARCSALAIAMLAALAIAGCEQSQPPGAAPTESNQSAGGTIQNPQSKIHDHIRFTDITAATGIDMTNTCGQAPAREILEVNGGGLGLIDFDNDGDLDLFVANGATLDQPQRGPGSRLFENLGNFRFRDITAQAQIDITRWANGVAIGDYDGDGFDDIFICCYGPNVLLRNNGDGTFADATAIAFPSQAANPTPRVPLWATSAAFGDIDNDGDLDLYVCNYLDFDPHNPPPRAKYKNVQVMGGPHGMPAQHDTLFENLGDGTFRDITQHAGCLDAQPSYGLNVLIADFDDDGWQDITVANDSMPDFLFWNRSAASASPRFEEIGVMSGIAANADGANQASMGLAIADVDGNGLPDKFTTVFSSDVNALHLNLSGVRDQGLGMTANEKSAPPTLLFSDRCQQYGLALVSRTLLGWSAGFFDFDLDGDEDLFFVNGHVFPEATMHAMDSDYLQPPMLFERSANRFIRVKPEAASGPAHWLAQPHRDRNAVFADLDRDGDIDIIISELNGPIRVMRNDAISNQRSEDSDQRSEDGSQRSDAVGGWIIVELRDERPQTKNHRGLGAKITLAPRAQNQMSIGGGMPPGQTRWLHTGGGFQSSGAPYVHFGLGVWPKDFPIPLIIRWPDGNTQRIDNVSPNQHLIVKCNQ